MNGKVLKWIAIITMTFDHIGFYLVPEGPLYLILRSIGRIAYPLFAFMIAEGFHKTSHLSRYWMRLAVAALVIELGLLGFYFIEGTSYLLTTNVFIPLVIGLSILILLKQQKWYLKLLIIPLLILPELLHTSYGIYGIMIILIFGLISHRVEQISTFILLSIFFIDWPVLLWIGLGEYARYMYIQWFSLLSFIPLFLYNGTRGTYNKWFFYIYYPAHLLVLFIIQFFMTR